MFTLAASKPILRTMEPFAPSTERLPTLVSAGAPIRQVQPTLALPTPAQIVDRAGPSFVVPPIVQEQLIPQAATDYDDIRNDVDRSGDGYIEVYNRPVAGGAALAAPPVTAMGEPVTGINTDPTATNPGAPSPSTFALLAIAVLGFLTIRSLA